MNWIPSLFVERPLLGFCLFLILSIWSAAWKGVALWRAGRNGHLPWFVCICIFNTLGILEMIYIFGFSQKK